MHAYEPDTTNPIPVISNSDVKPVTWEECDLRHWLNGEFIASAFNEVEQTRVCETAVKNPPNPWYGASGGNTTRDKAFCISITESSYLLGPDAQRWAHSQEQWWLRSPGGRDGISAATADADEIFFFGDFVGHDHGVRPLIWATWNGEALAIRHPQSLDFTTKGSFLKGCRIKRGKEYACVPRGITTIGDLAFADSFFLRFAYLPEGVISIGDLAFYGCEWLEAIWLPNSLVSIGEEAFRGCKRMKSIVIPENVMDISYEAFARCTFLTEFEIKGDLRRVAMWPDDVFDNTPCEERYKQLHEKAQWAALNALFNKE